MNVSRAAEVYFIKWFHDVNYGIGFCTKDGRLFKLVLSSVVNRLPNSF